MNPTVMNQTAPQQHDDAARSLPQVDGCAIASFRRPASGSHRPHFLEPLTVEAAGFARFARESSLVNLGSG
jgi:hypothetical protein